MTFHSYDTHPRDFWALLKPRVMSLSIFTAFCGMILAPGSIHPLMGFGSIFCIAMGAGGAGCLNMWCEIHRDAVMTRTQNRPLPAGRMDPNSALAFGLFLSVFSVGLLGLMTNWMAAFWLFVTIFSYVVIYTLILKTRTPQNIVIGGASGALPPVIGWVSVTGHADLAAWGLFLIIFFWTPAHFWALCLDQNHDYAAAGFPMMPSIHGDQTTRRGIVFYTLFTVLTSLFLPMFIPLGHVYFYGAILLSLIFFIESLRVLYKKSSSRRFFFLSIFYLFILFLLMIYK